MTEKLIQELNRLKKIRDVNHWEPVRGPKNFIKSKLSTPTGDRAVWIPKDDNHNKDLQSSRSVGLGGVEELNDIEINFNSGMELTHTDIVRIKELEEVISIYNSISVNHNLPSFKMHGMCEIGFRYPRLMKAYADKHGVPVEGYDVSTMAVEYAKSKGYNAKECDINHDSINLDDSNLVVMYHVLEHLSNPCEAIKKIFNALPEYSICHFEVPIENEKPQFEYGHLFGFCPGDLVHYVSNAGFAILSQVTKNIGETAVHIERITGMKISV